VSLVDEENVDAEQSLELIVQFFVPWYGQAALNIMKQLHLAPIHLQYEQYSPHYMLSEYFHTRFVWLVSYTTIGFY
jgi:hypothetical protein